jgi:polyhydroxyalkanoate synthesis regulator phasin
MIELTERAKIISQEAGTKVSSAMRDVIGAAAGLAGFAVESARDLVQYMVRRGQMTQDEADKLIREAEAVQAKKPASQSRPGFSKKPEKASAAEPSRRAPATSAAAKKPAEATTKSAAASKKPAAKSAAKHPAKTPKKPVAKSAAKSASKTAAKSGAKASAKSSGKPKSAAKKR